jgi:hypothetical protein
MSRIGDYVIGEQEEGRIDVTHDNGEPSIPERDGGIQLDDNVPIPNRLADRSDLNTRFGDLQSTFEKMNEGQSFLLSGMTDKELVALRARVSRANKKLSATFRLSTEGKDESGIKGRVFRIE